MMKSLFKQARWKVNEKKKKKKQLHVDGFWGE